MSLEPIHPVETLLIEAIEKAAREELASVSTDASIKSDVNARARFLVWLLCVEANRRAPSLRRITLSGATVEGDFDLSSRSVTVSPRFVGCSFTNRILLNDTKISSFEILGGELLELTADRIAVLGPLAIRKPHHRDSDIGADYRKAPIVRRKVTVHGAVVGGNFDLRGCRLFGEDRTPLFADGLVVKGNLLLSDRFEANGEIRLNGCQITRNLDFSGAKLRNPTGNCLSIEQSRISGDASFCFPRDWPIYSEPARFTAIGTLALAGTRIEGELDCSGGYFAAPIYAKRSPKEKCGDDDSRLIAIQASGISVGDGVRLGNGSHIRGEVNLVNARVIGDFDCDGGFFNNPGRDAISADGMTVSGTTFFRVGTASRRVAEKYVDISRRTKTNGFIRLAYAEMKQGLMIERVHFTAGWPESVDTRIEPRSNVEATCGIRAPYAVIGGSFYFKRLSSSGTFGSKPVRLELDLRQARASEIVDDKFSWDLVSNLHLGGFEYSAIRDLGSKELWRCDLLDRHYARRSGKEVELARGFSHFQPQPYLKLAHVMQMAGYDSAATTVRIRLERNRTEYGDYGFVTQFLRYLFDWTIRFGYKPFRVLSFFLIWLAISTAAFHFLRDDHIIPARRTASQMAAPTTDLADSSAGKYDIKFSALLFALDTLVPIVDLRQRSQYLIQSPTLEPWHVAFRDTLNSPQDAGTHLVVLVRAVAVPLLGVINPLLGWALTTLFVIGVTGLVRKS